MGRPPLIYGTDEFQSLCFKLDALWQPQPDKQRESTECIGRLISIHQQPGCCKSRNKHTIHNYPEWQAYFRKFQPPTLIVWGKNDYIFPADGAYPYKRDLKKVAFNLLDTGHFALEEDGKIIAVKIRAFLCK